MMPDAAKKTFVANPPIGLSPKPDLSEMCKRLLQENVWKDVVIKGLDLLIQVCSTWHSTEAFRSSS